MSLKNTLTNEKLNQRFTNPFALVTYAISLVKTKLERGEGIHSNPANQVLEEIASGRDKLSDLNKMDSEQETPEQLVR